MDAKPHDSRGLPLGAVCVTFLTITTIAVALRVFVRIRLLKLFGIEDAFMVAAYLCFVMFNTAALAGIHYGTGRHAWDIAPADMRQAFRYWWICYIAYTSTMIAVKLSVGVTLLKITTNKIHIRILYTIMTISVLTGTIFFFLVIFQCQPVSYFWDRAVGAPGTCLSMDIIESVTYAYSAVNTVTDFTFGTLPIFIIMGLHMDNKTKILLIPILSMACIASTAILVRMAYIRDFANPDFLYATIDIAIWSCTEQGLAITAGSLATLRPLFRIISSHLGFSTQSHSHGAPATPTPHLGGGGGGGVGSKNRLSRSGFGVVSFRNSQPGDSYHRMDDIAASESSRTTLSNAGKAYERDLEYGGGEWPEAKEHGFGGEDMGGGPGMPRVLQINKKIEIETKVEPRSYEP